MIRRLGFFLGLGLLIAYALMNLDITDYQQGYGQAVRDAQQGTENIGRVAQIGAPLMQAAQTCPAHPEKSANWNDGYRVGIRNSLNPQR